ncbi:MAG: hypothetical protein QG567_703 [Campylobacterota bacterium]|nr:hypothetical protein [Campylobacterota bacterium]
MTSIISVTIEGLSLARDEFTTLTGSDDWGEWIDYPEYMVGSCIMRHIKSRVPQVRVWPEVAPRFVSSAKDIRQGRIDIVIDDENDTPVTVIEVKANIGLEKDFEAKGVKEDIERLCAILNAPLSAKLSLGLFAFIANRDDTLLGKTLPNIEKLCAEVARAKGLKLQAYSKKLERSDKKWEAYAIVYAITKE